MIDLETMGTVSNSAIVSIGAVKFTNKILDSFYCNVDLQSCIDVGLKCDGDTILWWLKQSKQARFSLSINPNTLQEALVSLSNWMGQCYEVWGNGATFDNVILSNAYFAVGLPQPWHWTKDRCYRTVRNLHPNITHTRKGVYHNALDDAIYQAEHLIKILNA